jgi:hypothetical protein
MAVVAVQIGHQPVFGVIGTGNHLVWYQKPQSQQLGQVSSRRIKASWWHIDKHRRFIKQRSQWMAPATT